MSRTKENTFESTLSEAISTGSQMIARVYIQAIVSYLENSDKHASEITLEELLENVHLPSNVRPGMNSISPAKNLASHASRRGRAPAKAKAVTSKTSSDPMKEEEGPPPKDSCGYVRRYGDSAGTYCLKSTDGIYYELEEGSRSFCSQCKNGKQQVKDIINGKSNTLAQQKSRGGGRKSKKSSDNLPEKPGDFLSAVPGDDPVDIKVIPLGDEGLYIVKDTPHVLWNNGSGYCLVATLLGEDIVPPTEESKAWAGENCLEVLDNADFFDKGDKHDEKNEAPEEPVKDDHHVVPPEEDHVESEETHHADAQPEPVHDEEAPPPKKIPSVKPKAKTGTVTARGTRTKPTTKSTPKGTLMPIPGMN